MSPKSAKEQNFYVFFITPSIVEIRRGTKPPRLHLETALRSGHKFTQRNWRGGRCLGTIHATLFMALHYGVAYQYNYGLPYAKNEVRLVTSPEIIALLKCPKWRSKNLS